MLKAYKYRIYPNKKQNKTIDRTLETCRYLYNDLLYERKFMYEYDKTNITYKWQQDSLLHRKKLNTYLQMVHSQVLQDVARRVDRAFKNFFCRVKNGGAPGYPRFKGKGRYNSITYPQSGYCIEGNKLKLSFIGNIKIKLHREIEGKVKTLSITKKTISIMLVFLAKWKANLCPIRGKPLE